MRRGGGFRPLLSVFQRKLKGGSFRPITGAEGDDYALIGLHRHKASGYQQVQRKGAGQHDAGKAVGILYLAAQAMHDIGFIAIMAQGVIRLAMIRSGHIASPG